MNPILVYYEQVYLFANISTSLHQQSHSLGVEKVRWLNIDSNKRIYRMGGKLRMKCMCLLLVLDI